LRGKLECSAVSSRSNSYFWDLAPRGASSGQCHLLASGTSSAESIIHNFPTTAEVDTVVGGQESHGH